LLPIRKGDEAHAVETAEADLPGGAGAAVEALGPDRLLGEIGSKPASSNPVRPI
jgi:hypothetical protein